jgi:hypothetical protein
MPSGSHSGGHGGGGGSHFSGRGSSSRGGGGGRRYGRGGGRFFFGYGQATSIFFILFVFALMAAIAFSSIAGLSKEKVGIIEADYMYYQDIIEDANESAESGDTSYIVEGTVVSKKQNTDTEKWYVTYYFLDGDGHKVYGYTYSVYTWDVVKDMDPGDTILLAVDSNPITQDTDSINLDYADMTLEDDGEYVVYLNNYKTYNTLSIVLYVASAMLIVVGIIARKKKEEV